MSRVERNKDIYEDGSRRSPIGRLLTVIGSVILAAAIIVCLALAAPRLAGIDSYVVVSGSMEPAIPVGSMVYSKACDPAELGEGDIIVFYETMGSGVPVTHRIVENDTDKGEIITKGDANAQADLAPVIYNNVTGKVVMHVPYLGLLAAPLSTMILSLLLNAMEVIAAAMIIIAGYLLTEAGARLRRRE